MLHHYINSLTDEHWALGKSSDGYHILLQVGDADGQQLRLKLTPQQANELIVELVKIGSESGGTVSEPDTGA